MNAIIPELTLSRNAVADDHIRLHASHGGNHLIHAGQPVVDNVLCVKPHQVGIVCGNEFLQLSLHIVEVAVHVRALCLGGARVNLLGVSRNFPPAGGTAAGIVLSLGPGRRREAPLTVVLPALSQIHVPEGPVRMMPVAHGVVDPEPESLFPAFAAEFGDHIALERGPLDDVVVRQLRIPHAESVVMLGRDDQVFHPRVFCHPDDGRGVKAGGVERGCDLLVLHVWNPARMLDPFGISADPPALVSTSQNRVGSPVNEHPEPSVAEPGHSGRSLLGGLSQSGLQQQTRQHQRNHHMFERASHDFLSFSGLNTWPPITFAAPTTQSG